MHDAHLVRILQRLSRLNSETRYGTEECGGADGALGGNDGLRFALGVDFWGLADQRFASVPVDPSHPLHVRYLFRISRPFVVSGRRQFGWRIVISDPLTLPSPHGDEGTRGLAQGSLTLFSPQRGEGTRGDYFGVVAKTIIAAKQVAGQLAHCR